jgi:hypothetical protein
LFDNKESLIRFLTDHGAERILFKCLAENDNCKQQIYLGGSFEALNQLPYSNVHPANINGRRPNYKASLNFFWVSYEFRIEKAPGTQLILYPKYPEVRLSGFLKKCSIAPREYLYPIPRPERRFNKGKDGRILVLGICNDGRILAYLALPETPLSNELAQLADDSKLFTQLEIEERVASVTELLARTQEIQRRGWIQACKMNTQGEIVPYNAINAGGYTLEACFGIIPNGRAEPDWRGWEIKAFTKNRVTLMTPEPDAGYYYDHRVEAFINRYGRRRAQGDYYFTGIHKCGFTNTTTNMEIILDGFDTRINRIVNVTGGLILLDSEGEPAAVWTFAKLLEHWGRKHAHAAYIPYRSRRITGIFEYQYMNPVKLGEGTDFGKFLQAFGSGNIVYDPGSKLFINERGNTQVKARNQFRMKVSELNALYNQFSDYTI